MAGVRRRRDGPRARRVRGSASSERRRLWHTGGVLTAVGYPGGVTLVRGVVAARLGVVQAVREGGAGALGLVRPGDGATFAAHVQPGELPLSESQRSRRRRRRSRGCQIRVPPRVSRRAQAEHVRRRGGQERARGGHHGRRTARRPRGAQTLVFAVRGEGGDGRRRAEENWRMDRRRLARPRRLSRISPPLRAPQRIRAPAGAPERRPAQVGQRAHALRAPGAVMQARNAHVRAPNIVHVGYAREERAQG